MKKTSKLRLFGGAILLFNLWLIGHYELDAASTLLLTIGFAIAYEFLIVRPARIFSDGIDNSPARNNSKSQCDDTQITGSSMNTSRSQSPNVVITEEHWETAQRELHTGARKSGLWARVFSEAQGNESKAQANYLGFRALELAREDLAREFKLQHAAEQAQRELRQAKLVEAISTGLIGDRPYEEFRDGSIEIETNWGEKRRFPSMQAARDYIGV